MIDLPGKLFQTPDFVSSFVKLMDALHSGLAAMELSESLFMLAMGTFIVMTLPLAIVTLKWVWTLWSDYKIKE